MANYIRQLSKASSIPTIYRGLLATSHYPRQQLQCPLGSGLVSTRAFGTDVRVSIKVPEKRDFFRKKYMNCMRTLDTNKDGIITRQDIVNIADDHKSMGLTEHCYKDLVKEYETISDALGLTDYSKALPLEEATENWMKKLETTNLDPSLEKTRFRIMFNNVDINRNGVISYDEWVNHCKAYGVKDHAETSFKAMDTNGDGTVSQEEFSAFIYEFFYTTDNDLHSSILYGPLQ